MSRPRIRTLKPEFFQDERVNSISRDARYVAIGLVTRADDRGRQQRVEQGILGHIFPTGDVQGRRLSRWLAEIVDVGFAWTYEAGPFGYLWLPRFWRHQRINRPSESELPAHPEDPYAHLPVMEAITAYRTEMLSESFTESLTEPVSEPLTPSRAGARSVPVVDVGVDVQGGEDGDDARDPLQQVFDAWIDATGRTTRTIFDSKRTKVIRRALRDHPLEDCTDAVRGWRHSPHHRGENATGTVFNELELLLRDAQHIEMFRDLERGARVQLQPVRGNGRESAGDLIDQMRGVA